MAKSTIFLCFLSLFLSATLCSGKNWCIVRVGVPEAKMQNVIDTVCSQMNCNAIKPGGNCYNPNTLTNHASYCLNMYYRAHNVCNLAVGNIAISDPSFGKCRYD